MQPPIGQGRVRCGKHPAVAGTAVVSGCMGGPVGARHGSRTFRRKKQRGDRRSGPWSEERGVDMLVSHHLEWQHLLRQPLDGDFAVPLLNLDADSLPA